MLINMFVSLVVTPNASWAQHGITVVDGHQTGTGLQQLVQPCGLIVDIDGTVFITDNKNHCIIAWKEGDKEGHVVAGGHGQGIQLNHPTNILIDRETNSLIISDLENNRIVSWPLNNSTRAKVLIENTHCWGLAMHKEGCLYVCDIDKHEVQRFSRGATEGTLVAGGNGRGDHLNQLSGPLYVFVDEEQSVYVSDYNNSRVMKWLKEAKVGIVVAGGNGPGKELTQLKYPHAVWVDGMGTVYVADSGNNRVVRWPKDERIGALVVGGNSRGNAANELDCPIGLSFDRRGNLYVADEGNQRVQLFKLEKN
jgi:sugar lactone lactonase YvrE